LLSSPLQSNGKITRITGSKAQLLLEQIADVNTDPLDETFNERPFVKPMSRGSFFFGKL
jgi:hypothetical protein